MNLNKKLIIVSNEKISINEDKICCENIDLKSIPEGLNKNFNVSLISKKSNIEYFHQINLKKIKSASNLFSYLFYIFKTLKLKNTNYLIISITPYTFFAFLILFIFRKKIYVYLRSNGYEEYKVILGFIGPLIFHIMSTTILFGSKIITCQKRLAGKNKYDLVFPSELSARWLQKINKPLLDKPRLLYVGRVKIEKGIFSLSKILNEVNINFEFSIVGGGDTHKLDRKYIENNKFIFHQFQNEINSLIKFYDKHNITILPSFTEAHPKVVDESLARLRPVIVFEEINHIIQDRQGLFVSKRNAAALSETIKFIMNNYLNIQENMKKNKLPTKQEFISQFTQILR